MSHLNPKPYDISYMDHLVHNIEFK